MHVSFADTAASFSATESMIVYSHIVQSVPVTSLVGVSECVVVREAADMKRNYERMSYSILASVHKQEVPAGTKQVV